MHVKLLLFNVSLSLCFVIGKGAINRLADSLQFHHRSTISPPHVQHRYNIRIKCKTCYNNKSGDKIGSPLMDETDYAIGFSLSTFLQYIYIYIYTPQHVTYIILK